MISLLHRHYDQPPRPLPPLLIPCTHLALSVLNHPCHSNPASTISSIFSFPQLRTSTHLTDTGIIIIAHHAPFPAPPPSHHPPPSGYLLPLLRSISAQPRRAGPARLPPHQGAPSLRRCQAHPCLGRDQCFFSHHSFGSTQPPPLRGHHSRARRRGGGGRGKDEEGRVKKGCKEIKRCVYNCCAYCCTYRSFFYLF